MKMKRTTGTLITIGALALSQLTIHAAVIFDNLVTPNDQGYQVNKGVIGGGQSVAMGFVIGGTSQTLSSVVLGLVGSTSPGFVVALYGGGNGTTPGSLLANLSGPASPSSANYYTYTPTGTPTLEANTTYYIVAACQSSDGNVHWNLGAASQNPGSSGEFSTPTMFYNTGSGWLSDSGKASMQVNGAGLSPVPEPSEWAAISFGVLGMVWVAKRRFMPARA